MEPWKHETEGDMVITHKFRPALLFCIPIRLGSGGVKQSIVCNLKMNPTVAISSRSMLINPRILFFSIWRIFFFITTSTKRYPENCPSFSPLDREVQTGENRHLIVTWLPQASRWSWIFYKFWHGQPKSWAAILIHEKLDALSLQLTIIFSLVSFK